MLKIIPHLSGSLRNERNHIHHKTMSTSTLPSPWSAFAWWIPILFASLCDPASGVSICRLQLKLGLISYIVIQLIQLHIIICGAVRILSQSGNAIYNNSVSVSLSFPTGFCSLLYISYHYFLTIKLHFTVF